MLTKLKGPKFLLLGILSLINLSVGFAQIDLFNEDFQVYPNGTTTGMSNEGIPWSIDCSQCTSGSYDVQNGAVENNNTDGVGVWQTGAIDISTCSTIEVSITYGGEPWDGSGNLEYNTECNFGNPCAGDPSMPLAGDCLACWDFMQFNILLDGVPTQMELIGSDAYHPQSTEVSFVLDCNTYSEAQLQVNAISWAANEFLHFDNIAMVCFESDVQASIDASPSTEVCEGGSVILTEVGGDAASWSWDGPAGSDNNQSWTINNFTASDEGFYTVTVTDANGCTATDEIELTVFDPMVSFTQTDIEMCVGECEEFEIEIIGAVGSTDLDLTVIYNSIEINIPVTINTNSFSVTICAVSGSVFNYNPFTNTVEIGADLTDQIELQWNSFTNNNCTFTVDETLTMDINEGPPTGSSGPHSYCEDGSGNVTLDLNQFNSEVNDGSGNTVNWYLDMQGNNPAPNPITTSGGTFYAFVVDGSCVSGPVAVQIIVTAGPQIFPIGDQSACDVFQFPMITGNNLTGFQAFYDGPGGTGNSYTPGQTTTTEGTYYIYDGSPGCDDEVSFNVTITPTPNIDPTFPIDTCGTYTLPPITGTDLSGTEAYYTSPNGGGTQYLPGEVISSSITLFLYDINNGCEDQETLLITISLGPSFTMPNEISACGSVILPEIVGSNLSGNEYYASDADGNPPIYNEGETITESTTLYIFDENLGCANSQPIEIIISTSQSINPPGDIEICEFYILPDIDITPSFDPAYYTEPLGAGIQYFPGDTIFTNTTLYIYDFDPNDPDCYVDVEFDVTINETLNAGEDATYNVCDNSIIDLNDYIGNGADSGGIFTDQSSSGALNGDTLDLTLTTLDEIIIAYEVSSSCGSDTSEIILTISDQLSAGPDLQLIVCSDDTLDLNDYITGDIGGIYINSNLDIIPSTLDFDTIIGPFYNVVYSIGDGISCPQDSAIIEIDITQNPEFTSASNVQVCNTYQLPMISGNNLSGLEMYMDSDGNEISVGTNLDTSQWVYVYDPGMENCSTLDSFYLTVNYDIEIDYNPTICQGDTILVGMMEFYAENLDGVVTISTNSNCDSIIDVSLVLLETDTTLYNQQFCFGQSVTIGGTVFDENNPSGEVYLDPLNPQTCDSLIIVNLEFTNATLSDYSETICESSSTNINGEVYDVNNTMGSDTLQSSTGCDSIVTINVDFYPEAIGEIDTILCSSESIIINGTTYDIDNDQGSELIQGGSINNCDSLINIQLEFYPVLEDTIQPVICESEEFIFNGTIYDNNNANGEEFVNFDGLGCDSLIYVNLSILQEVEFDLDTTLCAGESIIINGTEYDEDNLTGIEILENQSSNGCDSTIIINIEIDDAFSLIEGTYCPDFSIDVNGEIFDQNNPLGQVFIQQVNSPCDSVVFVNLSFYEIQEGLIEDSTCEGASITINGNTYDENNPTGSFVSQTANGCDSVTQVNITFLPSEAEVSIDQPTCDDPSVTLVFESANFGGNYYYFNNDGVPINIDIPGSISVDTSGAYDITVGSDEGCEVDLSFIIDDIDEVNVTLPNNVEIEAGELYEISIDLPLGSTILWTPSTGLSCNDCPNPTASPTETITYQYVITTPDLCEHIGSITIQVREREIDFFTPNIFSPNGDGVNEVFFLSSSDEVLYDLMIFDRWGNRIFNGEKLPSNSAEDGWNGSFNEKKVGTGVFLYQIEVFDPIDLNQSIEVITGTITVIR